jgi:putative flippase GtrA
VIVFRELFLFGLVGIAGFVVDTGILYLLKSALGLYYARLISFTCAVFATWILNRHLTFRKRASGLSLTHEFSRYFGLMLSGGVVNYATYALLIYFYDYVARQPVWGWLQVAYWVLWSTTDAQIERAITVIHFLLPADVKMAFQVRLQ